MSPSQAKRAKGRTAKLEQGGAPEIDVGESPIGWLYRRRDKDGQPLISRAEFEAGERLRADFCFAQMMPRVTSSWAAPTGSPSGRRGAPGSGSDLQDNVIAAGERVRRRSRAVGPELSGVLIDVCCHLKGLESEGAAGGLAAAVGQDRAPHALKSLARHYGLIRETEADHSHRRPRPSLGSRGLPP